MKTVRFDQLNISEELNRAIQDMGFWRDYTYSGSSNLIY